jgi:hypothetical protein
MKPLKKVSYNLSELLCSPKTGPLDMLEYPEIEEEGSDEKHEVQVMSTF